MPVGGAMIENATLFVVYNQTQYLLKSLRPAHLRQTEVAPISELALAGVAAGAAASFVLTPIELVKCRMQVQMIGAEAEALRKAAALGDPEHLARFRPKMPGPIAITLAQIRSSGFGGLWLGQTGTLLREAIGSGGWFFTFEAVTRYFQSRLGPTAKKSDLHIGHYMLGGFAAGLVFTTSVYPADSIKSAMQVQEELGGKAKSFMQTGRDIWRSRGLRGLYAGCGVTCIKSGPSSALIFGIYTLLENRFG